MVKGIPNGIGATIQDLILFNPDTSIYDLFDLLTNCLQDSLPSVALHTVATLKKILII